MIIQPPVIIVEILRITYICTTIILFIGGLNSLILSILHLLKRKEILNPSTPAAPVEWPYVTVQLPVYNEKYVVPRLLEAVTQFDYPADKLQIQVLDDSTDSTSDLCRQEVEHYRSMGCNIVWIHRLERDGYKAGALTNGLKTASGEFIAMFDADFKPASDWLKKVVPHFQEPKVAFVQTRWRHVNDKYNLLTRMLAMAIDGHFIVEQGTRSYYHLLMAFNGAGGIWRKAAIKDAGGWQSDTLTEDLDLSLRAELKGWDYRYLPQVTVASELPVQIEAVKKQQHRWAKGCTQTIRKLFWMFLTAKMPWYKKVMGFLHMMSLYPIYPIILLSLVLMLPVGLYTSSVTRMFPWTVISSLGPVLMYCSTQTEHFPKIWNRILMLPFVTVFGAGISVTCTSGVLSGLFKMGGVFERTPKYDVVDRKDAWSSSIYVLKTSPVVWLELFMGIYLILTLVVLWPTIGKALAPWLLISSSGFFLVAGLAIFQSFERLQKSDMKAEQA
jgi:cellulose synthase/poly-beta-1,6-N-acetylglucosamine synthase-like glycosyltransferase